MALADLRSAHRQYGVTGSREPFPRTTWFTCDRYVCCSAGWASTPVLRWVRRTCVFVVAINTNLAAIAGSASARSSGN